jgi:hypothetical protein
MSAALSTPEYTALDEDAYKHQRLLLKAQHCAYPVQFDGKERFIHTLTSALAGGHVEMTVYLTGSPAPIDSAQITVPERKT